MEPASRQLAEAVRKGDNDRYLAALYAPEAKREALLALYAFNIEIASVRDRIHEPMPGEIRLQWWRDILSGGIAGTATGHPVADVLTRAIRANDLPLTAFQNYLEARIFDLYDDPMPSRTDLEGYCGETAGALIQLASIVLDANAARNFAAAAGHAGCAQAICGLLRLLPVHRARGQCYLPRDMLAAAGTTPEEFVSENSPASAGRALSAMIALANEHLSAFHAASRTMPAGLRPAFLPLALVPAYLAELTKAGTSALNASPPMATWKRHWLMLRAASRGF